LERTLAILAFDLKQAPNDATRVVLEQVGDVERLRTAQRVNDALMKSDVLRSRGRIQDLLHWCSWVQSGLRGRNIKVPEMKDVMLGVENEVVTQDDDTMGGEVN